ncbi:hypothetical protein RJ639_010100 [Escallonia herrerae]|uniref:Pectate lyase n=1 Tax=Escallonia herrerae TaxID=1293975 RepID=A0AA88VT73_9ASTE|nr:hypothetical protein RJ639_010100 [Escallonia herrerae]
MALQGFQAARWPLVLLLGVAIILMTPSTPVLAKRSSARLNVIDRCWRRNPSWRSNRQQLATCSVGYAGKMTNNIGRGVTLYKVNDPSDDALNPRPGTLRYGVTKIKGKVWITFQRDMRIKLQKSLLVSSFTAIDGRGASVHIAGGACLMLLRATNVIIHGLRIHDCKAQGPGHVMGPDGEIVNLGPVDGDAIRVVTSSKIWIDHNTLYDCQDGLVDVTRGSTGVTISNNWFRYQNKVMLLGHDDGFLRDKNMKVTVAFNYFGPGCVQRMPRVRHGYAHVVNNLYQGWGQYAIGGSMNPSVKSQANLFIAPKSGNKEVTWRKTDKNGMSFNFKSVEDVFENGASFTQTHGGGGLKPNYNFEERFQVADARSVRSLTRSSGALRCSKSSC